MQVLSNTFFPAAITSGVCGSGFGPDLAADTRYQHFDGIAVRLTIGAIDMLGQFALADNPPGMVHQCLAVVFEVRCQQRLNRRPNEIDDGSQVS